MSHFSTTPLAISTLADLQTAVAALGLQLIMPQAPEETVQIVGWGNARRRAVCKLAGGDLNRYGYEIGFRFDEPTKTYHMIGDWMGATVSPLTLAEQLNNEVAVAGSLAELAALGYDTSEITVTRENGEIRILAGAAVAAPVYAY